ncbi:DUF4352 domain-containing protein [Mycetocola spongiae]|uniref:DUF4352 domain-containing protein n=1 Tax=Mycetocola spongiae TaxID=2859226 RepID=UPI001CF4616F|nr:DUF4352 domain-containing protein [Mycetocola spongiae]UCR88151.1 DUF4352 domain-containing protein [Mycetocola spongiae]
MTTQPPAPETPLAAAPKKKNFFARHKVLTVIGAVIAVIIIANIANGAGTDKTAQGPAETAGGQTQAAGEKPAEKPADDVPGFGTPVTAGKLEFTAIALDPAGTQVGGEYLNATAQGQFMRLQIRVANVGDKPATFTVNSLKLTDESGRTFDADSSATVYDQPDSQTWIAQINPGNAVEGAVIFDIPADATPVELTVSDNMFSGGKKIALR